MGKNGDPQTGWMKEEVLWCSFQVDKFQQMSTNQGLGRIKLITCLSSEKFEKIGEGGRLFFIIFYFFG